MTRIHAAAIAVLGAGAFLPLTVAAQETAARPSFPGGATTITETHDDWTLTCTAGHPCVASQTLGTSESRRPILSMEVVARPGGGANALLTMPFGLDLREPVFVRLDEGAMSAQVPFAACTEQGCLVSISMEPAELELFRNGQKLHLGAKPVDDENPLSFTISMRGFASALDRAASLVD